jgi:hypothetical protein
MGHARLQANRKSIAVINCCFQAISQAMRRFFAFLKVGEHYCDITPIILYSVSPEK